MIRYLASLLLLAPSFVHADDVSYRPPAPKAWEGPFPVCASLPARIEPDPRLALSPTGTVFLGDPVAYGLGLAVAAMRNARTERTSSAMHWPADSAALAGRLRDGLVSGLDATAFGTVQPDGEASADCPWILRVRSRTILSQQLEGLHLITYFSIEPRDGSGPVAYASHLTQVVSEPEIATMRSKGDREAAWAALDEARMAELLVAAFRDAARILSHDALARGLKPGKRAAPRRFIMTGGGAFHRGLTVGRVADHVLIYSRPFHLVAQPAWMTPP